MRRLLSGGAMGALSLALLLPVIAPCLCPGSVGAGDCCPSPSRFDAAPSKDDCCVAPAAQPASSAEAAGTLRAPWVAVTTAPTVRAGDFRIIAQSPPMDAPLFGAPRPLLHLRI